MPNKNVAVIIPAYNESTVIIGVIEGITEELDGLTFKIIVIDDGSRDQTAALAKSAGATVVSHILNSGSGAATSTGLRYAAMNDFDYAATIDADGQHRPEDLRAIIIRLQESDHPDLVVGSRLIDSTGMSTVKSCGNKGLSFVTKTLFGIGVTDSQSGLRGFSKKTLHSINLRSQGYEFCSEMLWRAKQKKLTVTEIPIKAIYTDYSKGKGQSNWNAFNIVSTLIRHRLLEVLNG